MSLYMGAALYIDVACAADCVAFVEEFLLRAIASEQPVSFPYYLTSTTPNWLRITRDSRIRSVDPSVIQTTHQHLLAGTISQVKYLSDRNGNMCIADGSFLALGIDDSRQLLVRIAFPKPLADRIEFVDIVRRLSEECECNYGHIESGPCLYVESLLEMWPIGWQGSRREHAIFISELEYLWDRRDEFVHMIPRAAWGNILSTSHIAKLGGEDRIRNQSGAYLVDHWNGNVYVQATESPWCFGRSELLMLNSFFEPARLRYDWEPLYWEPDSA